MQSDKEIHMDMFRVPDKSKQQLQLLDLFGKYNHTLNQVLWKYQQRWKIVGGLDVSLDDFPPTPACPYTAGNRLIRVDMFVMAMCPFCAKAVKEMLAKDWINCEVECPKVGSSPAFKGTMEFNTHYVGMRNGSHLLPLHGPHELVGDKLELCARQHYAKDYKFMDFIGCMDRNITVMPALAKSCARRHGLDFKLLEACANTHGHDLLASSFAFSSSRGVDMTPLFLLNDHKKVLGLRNNFTAILCQEMREHHMPQGGHQGDKQWLHVVDAERENLAESNIAMRLFLPTPISLAATGVVLFAILVVIWRLRNNASKREEMQSLLPSRHAHARPGSRGSV